jgi:hypothetical protein
MTRRSRSQWTPPQQIGRRRGLTGYDPFYAFEKLARDDGKPYQPPEPKAERELLALLSGKAAFVVMSCLLAAVVLAVLVVVVVKM